VKQFLLIGFSVLILLLNPVFGQRTSDKYNRYFSKDQFSFTITSAQWIANKSVPNPSAFSRGVTMQMMYPIIGNRSNVALAIGFGFASQSYFLTSFVKSNSDSAWFKPIPDTISYHKYKISTNYITFPIEFRFRTNPDANYRRSFKVYPGFRIGGLVNFHSKYVGEDPQTLEPIKVKEYYLRHMNQFD